jgi:hypothetical protein
LRKGDGTIITIDVPKAIETGANSINLSGTITGFYVSVKNGPAHGFVRTSDGHLSTFDVPGAQSTDPLSINTAGGWPTFAVLAKVGTYAACAGILIFVSSPLSAKKNCDRRPRRPHLYKERKGGPAAYSKRAPFYNAISSTISSTTIALPPSA